jgi:nucleoside-diphosphate-sugar epimerase
LLENGFDVAALDYAVKENSSITSIDYRSLTKDDLAQYKTVIWLAGSSSVKKATDDPAEAFENNVSGLIRLVQFLKPTQRLIYASSASLYSGNESPNTLITEDVIGFQYQNAYDLSKYAFDKLVSQMNVNFCGLRFGTVCGTSKNQRHELLLNSMVRSAVNNGEVQVSNPEARRSVLAMNDLLTTIQGLIEVVPESGFYNLASYSMSIGEFGQAVADQLNAKIKIVPGTGTYTFSVDSSKICDALGRQLKTSFPSLIEELSQYYQAEHIGVAK